MYVGHSQPEDDVVFRGDVDDGAFLVFWLHQQRVTAAMNINIWDVNDQLRSMIGRQISADRLTDTGIALAAL